MNNVPGAIGVNPIVNFRVASEVPESEYGFIDHSASRVRGGVLGHREPCLSGFNLDFI